ncbi:MAG: transporter substrate-binding domain-containing protein [Oscillospiraceae bacterium]|nr:transporter substrate-binding domain-containing protein [Oscillospiraceae bacterium]
MKRLFCLLLALVLCLSFAACSSTAETETETETEAEGEGARPVLRVGMECGYAPYNWSQSDDSNGAVPIVGTSNYAYGYDVMIAKYLADFMDYDLEIYQIDWDGLPLAVQSGTIDCVIAGQSITAERLETVDFTTPYYYASIKALTVAGSEYENATSIEELAGATVTSQLNTVWYDVCIPQIPDVNALPAMESAPAMWVALDSGTCNLLVTDEPAALGACAVYPDFVMLDLSAGDFEVSEEEINIGISVQKGNSELLDQLNAGLATLDADDFTRLMNEAISVQPSNA